MVSATEIIADIEEKCPLSNQPNISNCSDVDINSEIKYIHQYIFGLTHHQAYSEKSFETYKFVMKEKLKEISRDIDIWGWSFNAEEINEVREAIIDLSKYYSAKLDIESMISNLNIKKDDSRMCYLAITIVPIKVAYVA